MPILPTVDIVDRPLSQGYDGQIDNVLIRLAVSRQDKLEDITAEAQPPRVDTAETAEDIRDEVGRRYSRSKLTGGAGLDFMHERSRPADAGTRFWSSRGVDVFREVSGETYAARLLNSVTVEYANASILKVVQCASEPYYATTGEVRDVATNTLRFTQTGITDVVGMGNNIYTLDDTGIGRWEVGTWTRNAVSATTTYDAIYGVKARILAVQDNQLYDATTDDLLLTVPAGETFTDVVDVGAAVMALATTGDALFLHLDQSAALVPAGMSSFTSEIPLKAVETFGVIGIVTADPTEAGGQVLRFYSANLQVAANYDLTNLQLEYQVGDRLTSDDLSPTAIYASRDSIFVATKEEGESVQTTWRYYLPTGGYARYLEVDDANPISSMVELDDRMYFGVAGSGVWKETDLYVQSGYIVGPIADFFTSDDKQWVGAELSGEVLPAGTALELYDTTDVALIDDEASPSWQLVTKLLAGGTSNQINDLAGRSSRFHLSKVVFRSDSSRIFSPAVQSWSFRALPNPNRDILLRIPINVSDQIESPGRRAISVPGYGDLMESALRAYEGRHVVIELYRPLLQVRGLIERFESTIENIPTYGSVRRVMYARVRGTRIEDALGTVKSTSGASLGQDTLGVIAMGQGEINA